MRAAHAQAHRPRADLELLVRLLLVHLRFDAAFDEPQPHRVGIDGQHLQRAARGQHDAAAARHPEGHEGIGAGDERVAGLDRQAGREDLFRHTRALARGPAFDRGDHRRALGHEPAVGKVQHRARLQQARLAHLVALLHFGPAQRRVQLLARDAPQGFAGLHHVRRLRARRRGDEQRGAGQEAVRAERGWVCRRHQESACGACCVASSR
ncbi:hypothetical protein D3C72_1610380 [compost metagenome]